MGLDKLVDSQRLDGALTATANKIRQKTGSSEAIPFDADTGFTDAVDELKKNTGTKTISTSYSAQTDIDVDGYQYAKITGIDVPSGKSFSVTGQGSVAYTPYSKNYGSISVKGYDGSSYMTAQIVTNGQWVKTTATQAGTYYGKVVVQSGGGSLPSDMKFAVYSATAPMPRSTSSSSIVYMSNVTISQTSLSARVQAQSVNATSVTQMLVFYALQNMTVTISSTSVSLTAGHQYTITAYGTKSSSSATSFNGGYVKLYDDTSGQQVYKSNISSGVSAGTITLTAS